ncbi:uncharacterized protein LOC125224868 isoform X4 [Leguminivora glycinivorella]|uniref:uncharacterized protein LOC125224868 isoform X4 n=1 Tax=Leguminivora glycinivorella TaxID=1035111 RepID=UPI00200F7CF0|nr:uncharacterized protein LOC125224868 isoform X4 [Leguminivora glycinivorella]
MDLTLSDADAEAGMHEVDCVPLLPLSDTVRDRFLPKQHSTQSLKAPSSFYGIDNTRRTSDATEVYQSQRKYASETSIRPRFNTVNDIYTDEIRRLRQRLDTRLHEAVIDEDISEIERLIGNGASPAALDHSGLTPLHLCILHKLIKPYEALLKHKDGANVRDARGLSVLHVAVLHRWLPGVDAALASGADVTALCDASKPLLSRSLNCERYQHVSYEDFVNAFVQTPIQLATKVGDLAMLLKLLDVAGQMGVINCRNKKGQTPLYTAIMNGNLDAVEILIKKGACVDIVSRRGESALHIAESFYIYLKRLHYFDSLESWVKLIGLILAAVLPLTVHFVEMAAWQRHVACAALLLVWLQAMFLLSRFPGWGYYVLMFGKVAINMFKVFITSICLVLGFAFCFMIQFQSEPPFDGPISAVVKTLIMMSSEFDYEDLFGQAHDKQLKHSRTIVRLLFLVFVIFVAIVLVNFMIAVAVSDINNLNIAGNISRLEKQVDLLSSLDVFVNCGPLSRMFKNKYGGKRYHKKMYNSIKANRTWFVECSSSVEMYPQILPSALYKAIIDIARKKDERFMNTNVKNASTTKLDALYDAIIGNGFGIDVNDKEKEAKTYWLRETIIKQNEKISQLQCDVLAIKEMLEDTKLTKTAGERISL